MITQLETLPNEILLNIFSYLPWFDMLTSVWSLNFRFNSLVCSILSINDNQLNSGLIITNGLSYNKCCSILFPLILNSLSLSSSIQLIHFDDTYSTASNLSYEWLFNDKYIIRFPNLKSLILTRCGSIEPIIQSLSYLIEHQLDELTLTFDWQAFKRLLNVQKYSSITLERELLVIKKFIRQLFSDRCQLTYLRLDIGNEFRFGSIHKCLASYSHLSSNFTQRQFPSCCVTLRRLYIRLNQASFLENLIEHVPNLEKLLVKFHSSLNNASSLSSNVEILKQSNGNWFHKVPKLRYFTLKTFIYTDLEFIYLKWLLNNFNYVEKLKLHLKSDEIIETKSKNIWKSFIDANFIRQYCLPDIIINLKDFNFYICRQCQLTISDIENITNSFKIHPFFIAHQWTNVKCLFDPIMSYQHLFSSFTKMLEFSNNFVIHPCILNWPYIGKHSPHCHPSLFLFLEQFNDLSPDISCIKVYKSHEMEFDKLDLSMSLQMLLKMNDFKGINIPFRNVTKIQFGTCFDRHRAHVTVPIERDELREKVLAQLISMPVQLKCLLVEQFEWLLHVVTYLFSDLELFIHTYRHDLKSLIILMIKIQLRSSTIFIKH
ncbi:unnamed protein product [Rotaria magnacalcarata]